MYEQTELMCWWSLLEASEGLVLLTIAMIRVSGLGIGILTLHTFSTNYFIHSD